MDALSASMKVAGSALEAQSNRMKVVSENIANARSTATDSAGSPYQRKTVAFTEMLDRASGLSKVETMPVQRDLSPFLLEHDPANPAADASGMVKMPNVNILVEMADMRQTNRSYEANLQVMAQVRGMISATLDMMKV
ncbi:MAG: flagellar basal body rod protein FlgC [Ahrensia sp.]|nr:flagellar basal body rod protein FlgC [Ahrensia sp.]